MSGTVNKQFEGDQKGNRQEGIAGGTPANHTRGNPDETSVTRQAGRYGVSTTAGEDLNDYRANGNGTMFDGMSRGDGYTPRGATTMDSPVVRCAPVLDTRSIRAENIAHLGQGVGARPSQAGDDLKAITGGVMSRGTVGTSKASAPETELTSYDTLRCQGPAIGSVRARKRRGAGQ